MDPYFSNPFQLFDEDEAVIHQQLGSDDFCFPLEKHITVENYDFCIEEIFTSNKTINILSPDEQPTRSETQLPTSISIEEETHKVNLEPANQNESEQNDKELLQNLMKILPIATIKKIPYNFGKTALRVEMIKLIKNNHYDDFIKNSLGKSKSFIHEFKRFCQRTCYETLRDFKEIWRYNTLIGYDFNDLRAVLTAVTKKFLEDDVGQWINKIKVKEYAVLYRKCSVVFLKGINDVESFDVSNYYV